MLAMACQVPAASISATPATFPAAGTPAATAGGGAVVGREVPAGTSREVELYDAATDTWSCGPDLPTPRHGIGIVAIGSTISVLTGGPLPFESKIAVCEALDLR